jgi:pimeloyl-ACP methyl ester carboxylesterase
LEEDAQELTAGPECFALHLAASPLAPGVSPVRIRCREWGRGAPLVFLHGGWGYEIYPFDRQIAALAGRYRIVIPDRSGYGGSSPIERLGPGFHLAAAAETRAVLDALDLRRPVLWGHSDGAVIAALIGLAAPDRVGALILEAIHLSGRKPASRAFFAATARDPTSVGERTRAVLARDHGDRWPQVVARHSAAWLRIADEQPPDADFYGGRLGDLAVPALILHGARDPRTEPGELDAVCAALPRAERGVLPEGGHSPHSERATAGEVARLAARFLG